MTKPTILTVDDDAMVSQAITRDLRKRYGDEYRVLPFTSAADALDALAALALRDRQVDIGLDYYLLKPWDPPEERLHPVVGLLDEWRQAHLDVIGGVRVIGSRWSDRSHDV